MDVKALCIFGTRPETIKMAPVVHALNLNKSIDCKVCLTGQHQEMLISLMNTLSLVADYNLKLMEPGQNLSDLTARIIQGLSSVFESYHPDIVLVHGDTTSTLAAALSAYYHHIPVAHVEAGLRTGNLYQPWPEEVNRKLTGALAMLHFAPTLEAKENLLREGVDPSMIYVTGNTVIDTLYQTIAQIDSNPQLLSCLKNQFPFLSDRKIILVTGHRRESFGEGFKQICHALVRIAQKYPEIDIVYPVHLNPNVQKPVKEMLSGIKNIFLIDPVDYVPFVYLMKKSYLILTDSGGIQEEAPALGKPVLVMRSITERPEALSSGIVRLVGTNAEIILKNIEELLSNTNAYEQMSKKESPYGDGQAAGRIVKVISEFNFKAKKALSEQKQLLTS